MVSMIFKIEFQFEIFLVREIVSSSNVRLDSIRKPNSNLKIQNKTNSNRIRTLKSQKCTSLHRKVKNVHHYIKNSKM